MIQGMHISKPVIAILLQYVIISPFLDLLHQKNSDTYHKFIAIEMHL